MTAALCFRCDDCGGRLRSNVRDLGGNWTFSEKQDIPLRRTVNLQRQLTGKIMCRSCCREYILLKGDQIPPKVRDLIMP